MFLCTLRWTGALHRQGQLAVHQGMNIGEQECLAVMDDLVNA
jgi:hypothetical protein